MRYMKVIVFLSLILLGGQWSAYSQNDDFNTDYKASRDRALEELKKYPAPDTFRVIALIHVFTRAVFLKQRQEVSPYRTEALMLSRKLNYARGLAASYLSYAHLYKSGGDKAKA